MPSTDAYFALQCPHCPARLKVTPSDIGSQRKCPRCGKTITVTPQARKGSPTGSHDTDAIRGKAPASPRLEFGITCDLCGTHFYATEDQVGQKVDCPDCLTEHLVRAPAKPPTRKQTVSPTPPDDADDYVLQPLEPTPMARAVRPDQPTFRVKCGVCGTMLVANESLIGKTIACHDCGTRVPIHAPPKPIVKPPRVVAIDPKIKIDAPAELLVTKQQADRMLSEARAHIEETDRKQPPPINQPFRDGILGFPFRRKIIPCWAAIAPLAVAVGWLIPTAMASEGPAQFLAIPMMLMSTVLILVMVFTISQCLMTILQSSAMGFPEPEEWASFDFGEWLGSAMFLSSALVLSALPAIIVSGFLPVAAKLPVAAFSVWLLFPFILMSMLDAGSAVVPYAPQVARTLVVGHPVWRTFYTVTGLMAVVLTGVCIAATLLPLAVSAMSVPFLVIITLTIYFHLLGRLAWALDQLPVPPEEDTPE